MCCPVCERGELRVAIPALDAREPIMRCTDCGVLLDSGFLGLYVDRALDRELATELKELLKAA